MRSPLHDTPAPGGSGEPPYRLVALAAQRSIVKAHRLLSRSQRARHCKGTFALLAGPQEARNAFTTFTAFLGGDTWLSVKRHARKHKKPGRQRRAGPAFPKLFRLIPLVPREM